MELVHTFLLSPRDHGLSALNISAETTRRRATYTASSYIYGEDEEKTNLLRISCHSCSSTPAEVSVPMIDHRCKSLTRCRDHSEDSAVSGLERGYFFRFVSSGRRWTSFGGECCTSRPRKNRHRSKRISARRTLFTNHARRYAAIIDDAPHCSGLRVRCLEQSSHDGCFFRRHNELFVC